MKKSIVLFSTCIISLASYCQSKNINEATASILRLQLDSIYFEDQHYRQMANDTATKYGWSSKQVDKVWEIIDQKDAANTKKVAAILDEYGWLGKDLIGEKANSALFLVIQHASPSTQIKYLPLMRTAVKNGSAKANSLALLEDRIALYQGKRQIYGSQVGQDPNSETYYVLPLEDPDNVDARRKEVGLNTMAEYLSHWKIKWDVEAYKKQLPLLEQKQNKH
jgi:hypothetical protein